MNTEVLIVGADPAGLAAAAGLRRRGPWQVLVVDREPQPGGVPRHGRPPGVMTTGELQQRVYLHGERLRGRALVVGAEHVSFSAMVTLAHAGADVVALVTELPRQQSYAAFALAALAGPCVGIDRGAEGRGPGAAGGGGACRPAHRPGRARRVRHAGLHRGLDSRP